MVICCLGGGLGAIGSFGLGPCKFGLEPGKFGLGPGKFGLGPGNFGLGPGNFGFGPGSFGWDPGTTGLGPTGFGLGLLNGLSLGSDGLGLGEVLATPAGGVVSKLDAFFPLSSTFSLGSGGFGLERCTGL